MQFDALPPGQSHHEAMAIGLCSKTKVNKKVSPFQKFIVAGKAQGKLSKGSILFFGEFFR